MKWRLVGGIGYNAEKTGVNGTLQLSPDPQLSYLSGHVFLGFSGRPTSTSDCQIL